LVLGGDFLEEKAGDFLGGFIYDHREDGAKLAAEGDSPKGC
jgi:hypothetical protein